MPLIKLYWTPALLLLLLALTCPLSQSLPVMSRGPFTDSCVSSARSLLHNITAALAQKDLFIRINCSELNVQMNMESSTAAVCTPVGSTCSGGSKLQFDQDSCVREIGKDLQYYYKILSAQRDPRNYLGTTLLPSLREFMTSCWTLPLDVSPPEAAGDSASSYDQRQTFCKVLRGFQVRAVTINRAMGYINSGEHMK